MPQGTLVERLRAGGAGLAGVYTPTGVGTPIADGKEVRFFDGKPFIFEPAIKVDYAFVTAYRADRLGNCEFRGSSQHFNPSFAKGARIAIVEVDEIVEPGEIDPHRVGLAGCFVARVVKRTVAARLRRSRPLPSRPRRSAHVQRQARLDARPDGRARRGAAARAQLRQPRAGHPDPGLATISQGRDITLHGENGILGYGGTADPDSIDYYVHDAGGNYVTEKPGHGLLRQRDRLRDGALGQDRRRRAGRLPG